MSKRATDAPGTTAQSRRQRWCFGIVLCVVAIGIGIGFYLARQQGAETVPPAPDDLESEREADWLRRAQQAMKQGETDAALGCLDRYVALRPEDPLGHLLRLRIHRDRGESGLAAEDVTKARESLPELGDIESFRKDQAPAREICRKLRLPELPDISGIDAGGQNQFHAMFSRLRGRPDLHDEYGLLGQLYEAQQFPELAVELYHRAINMAPDDYEWHYALALRLAKDGRIDAAEAEFKQASELNPKYTPVWMHLAWRAVERDDTDAALGLIDRYIALRPEDPFGYVQRAQLRYDQGQWEAMQSDLEKAKALEDQGRGHVGKQGHRLFGALYRHLGQQEKSRLHLLMSAERLPGGEMDDPVGIRVRQLQTSRYPLVTKLDGLIDSKRYRDALELADDLFARYGKDHPDYPIIYGKLAECCRQLRDYRNAARYAFEACRLQPDRPEPYAELALIFVNVGKFAEALEAANKALELKPDMLVALYARALTQIQIAVMEKNFPPPQGQADPAARLAGVIEDLEQCIKKDPIELSYLVGLATAHGMLGHFDQANRLLDAALCVSPNDENTRKLKARAEARQSFWPVLKRPTTAPSTQESPPVPE